MNALPRMVKDSSNLLVGWVPVRRAPGLSGLGAVDDLGLGEAEQPPRAVLDADAAPLGPAEGLVRRQGEVGVDPRRAALELLGDLGGPVHVGAPDRAGQRSEARRVGKGCVSTGRSRWVP